MANAALQGLDLDGRAFRPLPTCRSCGGVGFSNFGKGDGKSEKRCNACGLLANEPRAWEKKCQCGFIHQSNLPCPRCHKVQPKIEKPTGGKEVRGPEQRTLPQAQTVEQVPEPKKADKRK